MKMSKKFHQDQSESDSQIAKNRGKYATTIIHFWCYQPDLMI